MHHHSYHCYHCPFCAGYAAGFRDGQASAHGYWSGPYRHGLQGQIGQQGLVQFQAQGLDRASSLQSQMACQNGQSQMNGGQQ
jgi:hypothetical protein